MKVYILNYKRSPIGSFLSQFKNISINNLSNQCINSLLDDFDRKNIDKIYIGNVLSAGLGQNIARQIGLDNNIDVPSITVNNVCGSGLLSVIEGVKSILLNESNCVLVGGVESMSNSPHICNIRNNKYGNLELIDSMQIDGLKDSFTNKTMTELSEELCYKQNITRKQYDDYAIEMYKRSRHAMNEGLFKKEITSININNKIIHNDEEIYKVEDLNKIYKLNPIYKDGISTPGNISKLSDGVAFMLLVSEKFINEHNIKPLAEIVDYDLSICDPKEAPICVTKSIQNLIKHNIDIYEINDAFPLCSIYTHKILNIPYNKINLYGSSISIGHPLGCSGLRILCTLLTILQNKQKNIGCACIANGGGGSTSIVIKIL